MNAHSADSYLPHTSARSAKHVCVLNGEVSHSQVATYFPENKMIGQLKNNCIISTISTIGEDNAFDGRPVLLNVNLRCMASLTFTTFLLLYDWSTVQYRQKAKYEHIQQT